MGSELLLASYYPDALFCSIVAVVFFFSSVDFVLTSRYTCPFVEKFSIDIETYYKPDTGDQVDVFNLSAADKRQRTIGETARFLLWDRENINADIILSVGVFRVLRN